MPQAIGERVGVHWDIFLSASGPDPSTLDRERCTQLCFAHILKYSFSFFQRVNFEGQSTTYDPASPPDAPVMIAALLMIVLLPIISC